MKNNFITVLNIPFFEGLSKISLRESDTSKIRHDFLSQRFRHIRRKLFPGEFKLRLGLGTYLDKVSSYWVEK